MCERHYTPSVVAELQAIAQMIELRNRLQALIDERKEAAMTVYGSGFVDGLEIVVGLLAELAPDYSQCDNPPTTE